MLNYFEEVDDIVAEEKDLNWRVDWDMPEFEAEMSGLYAPEHIVEEFFDQMEGQAYMTR